MAKHTGVFNNLDPSQFYFAGTAVIDEEFEYYGPGTFVQFLLLNKIALRVAYAAAEGDANPVIVLANKTHVRGYVATDDETLEDFCVRLSQESRNMKATRLFWWRRAKVTAFPKNLPIAEQMMDESIDAGETEYELHDGIVWYAEASAADDDEGAPVRVSGIMDLAGPERLIDPKMLSQQPMDLLVGILE